MSTTEDQIKKMYSAQLASQKEQLQQDYKAADANYAAEKEKAQKVTDANLTRTAVESQKAAVNNSELHNAYGLSSGTRAQARLAQENQLQADLTALRMQQQEVDADVERQRSLLAQEFASAIRQAQAENDLAKAQALYDEAQRQQDALLAQQQAQADNALAAAKLMADAGDYTRLAKIYGLTPAELTSLMGETAPSTPVKEDIETTPTSSYNPTVAAAFDAAVRQAKAAGKATTHTGSSGKTHGGSSGSFGNSTQQTNSTEPTPDQDSITALGFGSISAETLDNLIRQGVVEEYVENGRLKYRKTYKATGLPYSKALFPNG